MLLHHSAALTAYDRSRQRRHSAVFLSELRTGHDHRIVDPHPLREASHLRRRSFILGCADDNELVLVLRLQCNELRDLLTAWPAPGGPKIEEDYFACQRGHRNHIPKKIANNKWRSQIRILHKMKDCRIWREGFRCNSRCGT